MEHTDRNASGKGPVRDAKGPSLGHASTTTFNLMGDTRAALWDSGHDEPVLVNQRALIDKVLARYSGEFTVFRELLQNSDDAAASTAEIHFYTQAYRDRLQSGFESLDPEDTFMRPLSFPDIDIQPLVQWTFRNDGMPFRDEDWNRLKKIAEGNPDEQKIGAFGVGFYSVFSVTDEPLVQSGSQWMQFYWKNNGDQLYIKRGDHSSTPGIAPSGSPWTVFNMPLRVPLPFPGVPVEIAHFLAASSTFMINLRDVSVHLDGYCLARVQRDVATSTSLAIPTNLIPKTSQMEIVSIHSSNIKITAHVIRWMYLAEKSSWIMPMGWELEGYLDLFLKLFVFIHALVQVPELPPPFPELPPAMLETLESSITLTAYSAKIDVSLKQKLLTELERATKKRPPASCSYSLIYTGKDDYDKSKLTSEEQLGDVFKGLRADLNESGAAKIFIGHATSQSTGFGGHVAARFMPTVERESVDLVDQNVSQWNKELLQIGGVLARCVYDTQMLALQSKHLDAKSRGTGEEVDEDTLRSLEAHSVHIMRFFSFYSTTPSPVVGLDMEEAFFSCSGDGSILVMSTAGVRSSREVRCYDPMINSFMKDFPLLPLSLSENATEMIGSLRHRRMLQEVSLEDATAGLSDRILTEHEMVKCLEWRIALDKGKDIRSHKVLAHVKFLEAAMFIHSHDKQSGANEIVSLATIKTFITRNGNIPSDLPLPLHTLPYTASNRFDSNTLRSVFGWDELKLHEWIEYLVGSSTSLPEDQNMAASEVFAEKVLGIIAKAWFTFEKEEKAQIKSILKDKTVIPTQKGLRMPSESYLPSAKQFRDLPIVSLPSDIPIRGGLRNLLEYIGVMRHVSLQVVLDRMIDTGNWDMRDFVRYLIKNRSSLPAIEFGSLRRKAIFPQESRENEDPNSAQKRTLHLLFELYEPLDSIRVLGLPVLDWAKHPWDSRSDEAILLLELGLKSYPDIQTIFDLTMKSEEKIRRAALRYLLDNFNTLYSNKYNRDDFAHLAFVPAVSHDGIHFFSNPNDVFTDPECAVMGFSVVEEDLRDSATYKLGISKHPPIHSIMRILLEKPPSEVETAKKYFEYLSRRTYEFSSGDTEALKDACIIPTTPSGDASEAPRMAKPRECLFTAERETLTFRAHSKLFTFVDFGTKANVFLKECGVKDRPDVEDILTLILEDPPKFLKLVGNVAEYWDQLRYVAAHGKYSADLISRMRGSPFLLGVLRDSSQRGLGTDDQSSEESGRITFTLLKAEQIVIMDDINAYSLFSRFLYVAPEEDRLEKFYERLGSEKLSTLFTEVCHPFDVENAESNTSKELRNLIIERFALFLHERKAYARVSPEWLLEADNFAVRLCGKLWLGRILRFQGKYTSKVHEVSAAAVMERWQGKNRLVLLLSKHNQMDMYDVARSICKVLLVSPKMNDSLLFMTILSTDLRALRRRGYNVKKILHEQQIKKEISEHRGKDEENSLIPEESQPKEGTSSPKIETHEHTAPTIQEVDQSVLLDQEPHKEESPIEKSQKEEIPDEQELPNEQPPNEQEPLDEQLGEQEASNEPKSPGKPAQVSKKDVDVQGPWLKMEMEEGYDHKFYCDVRARDTYFEASERISGYRVFMVNGSNPQDVILDKRQVMERFALSILHPLETVFDLKSNSLNIFYDKDGDLIAFNKGGDLFLNIRPYEQWHDEDVRKGKTENALISWYHTLAHQLAHDYIRYHNREHEFYFLAICEQHFLEFVKVLKTRPDM